MNLKSTVSLSIMLLLVSLNSNATDALQTNFKGQLSLDLVATPSVSNHRGQSVLRYLPEFNLAKPLGSVYSWDIDTSFNTYIDYQNKQTDELSATASLYRLNARLASPHSDTRIGLQKINFGPALLLRSLRWFDQVNPADPLELTNGVIAIRYRYFFVNNANLWLWGLYGNKEPKGFELIGTQKQTPEFGARFQNTMLGGDLGFSFHTRSTEGLGFSGQQTEKKFQERRYAVDGRWDLALGLWFEYVLIDQGSTSTTADNWVNMLTLGTDYTLGIGNGLHIVVEHLVRTLSQSALQWEQQFNVSAAQLTYPVGLLDAFSLLHFYLWDQQQAIHFMRWTRTYDNWVFGFAAFAAPHDAENVLGISGNGLQATIIFNH